MRVLLAVAAGLWFALTPAAAQIASSRPDSIPIPPTVLKAPGETTEAPPPRWMPPCATVSAPASQCEVSPEVLKKAQAAFHKGMALRQKRPEDALAFLSEASNLVPRNLEFSRTMAFVREQLVFRHIQRGNELASQQRTVESAAEFQKALELDPGNAFLQERLRDVSGVRPPPAPGWVEPPSEPLDSLIQPRRGRYTLHLNGDTRSAYRQIGSMYGIQVRFDNSTPSAGVRLDLEKVTFAQAMNAVAVLTRTFWTPVSADEALVAADNPANRKELEHWVLRSFYLPDAKTPQELNDIANLLKTIFELKIVLTAAGSSQISVRGPALVVQAASEFLQTLWAGRPQVLFDLEVWEISHQVTQAIGLKLPQQISVYNIPQSVVTYLENNTQLLQELTSSGLSSSSISALLAQYGLQDYASLLENPFVTFGGGNTLMAMTVPSITANFSRSESRSSLLDKVTLRTAQADQATFRLGTRYPVMNSVVTSLVPTTSSTSSTSSSSYPLISYEDLGLTIKMKPWVQEGAVTLELEVEMKALSGSTNNSIPVITNSSYKGTISLKDYQPAVVAGALSSSEQNSLSGLPGMGGVPGLSVVTTNQSKQHDDNEFLVLITPHIVRSGPNKSTPPLALPRMQ